MAKRNLDTHIQIRVSEYEKHRIKMLADNFAKGNMSLWIVYASLNAPREVIDEDVIEETKRKIKNGHLKDDRPNFMEETY